MEKVSITTSLLNTIVQYLANRPYIEVAGMIERVQTELKAGKALGEQNRQEAWKDGSSKDSEGS
jgi:hypothetical protein